MFQAANIHTPFLRDRHARGVPVMLDRRTIESAIEHLIAALDLFDGECDIEDDDPAGDFLDRGEEDEVRRTLDLPRYAIDQTQGPVNAREAIDKWDRARR